MLKWSIIIPFKNTTLSLFETLEHLEKLEGPSFEVILLPDVEISAETFCKHSYTLRINSTGEVSPALKRDIGSSIAHGKFLAFLDDDAYPAPDWLLRIQDSFNSTDIAAVGGPQLTPPNDPFWAQVSGAMFLSCLNGNSVNRYLQSKQMDFVDDWPSVNLCVLKSDFDKIGGFDSNFWPGEDTKLCLDIVHTLHKRILFNGKAVVYHHRRACFIKHMRQIGGYGLHRGHFARIFPQTSRRLSYFVPSLFTLFVIFGWFALLGDVSWQQAYISIWLLYGAALLVSLGSVQAHVKNWTVALLAQVYLVCTHFWYGVNFINGFLSNSVYSRLER